MEIKELKGRDRFISYLFVLPLLILLMGLIVIPFFTAIFMSLSKWRVGNGFMDFVGIDNYAATFKSIMFTKAFRNTMIWVFVSVLVKVILGMALAVLLNQRFLFSGFIRSLILIPWVMPTTISALVWVWIFNDLGGALNALLMALKFIHNPVPWLGKGNSALLSVVSVNIWRGTPFFAITLLAGLKNIPKERYEAAKIDGANAIQSFIYMTIPGLRHVLMVSTLLEAMWAIGDFSIVYKMTKGGPAGATHLLSTLSYEVGFLGGDLGRAVSVSLFPLPILALLIILITRAMDKGDPS
jgi:multiple sugar transport system permease protein